MILYSCSVVIAVPLRFRQRILCDKLAQSADLGGEEGLSLAPENVNQYLVVRTYNDGRGGISACGVPVYCLFEGAKLCHLSHGK
jgi:hypothetical protein